MTDDMDLLDDIQRALMEDEAFAKSMGAETSSETLFKKIRTEIAPDDEVSVDDLNFISMYLSSATETTNDYVSRGFLNVDFYCTDRYAAKEVKKALEDVFSSMGMRSTSAYNEASKIKGVYKYTKKYRPLIWA